MLSDPINVVLLLLDYHAVRNIMPCAVRCVPCYTNMMGFIIYYTFCDHMVTQSTMLCHNLCTTKC